MLLSIALLASLLPWQQASMRCVGGASDAATVQTQPLGGPGGGSAQLKVSSDDDHSRNTHLCGAAYVLLMRPNDANGARAVDLLASDADWDRVLSLSLDGFSYDGKRVFGVLTERGKYSSATLFDYDTVHDQVHLVNLNKQFAHVVAARCNSTFDVVATTETGAIVVALSSTKPCKNNSRWLLTSEGSSARRLSQGASVLNLFNPGMNGNAQTSGSGQPSVSIVIESSVQTVTTGNDWKVEGAIKNVSDETIAFSFDRAVFKEDVRGGGNKPVPRIAHRKIVAKDEVEATEGSDLTLFLAPHESWPIEWAPNREFDLNEPGKYTAQATLVLDGNVVKSNVLSVNVVP